MWGLSSAVWRSSRMPVALLAPLTLPSPPSGGEGIEAPSPSARERAGVRVGAWALRPPGSTLEELLHDQHVHPLAVEATLLPIDAHGDEAHALVERDAGLVGGEACEHELVEGDAPAELDETGEENAA